MKTNILKTALFSLALFSSGYVNAQTLNISSRIPAGGVATGGGDVCEERIQEVRDDIKAWILAGGAKALVLPSGVSNSKYINGMLEKIKSAKIRCVGNGDAGYPVTVEGTPKVCRFDRSNSSDQITCDTKKFKALSESEQYVLVHHEYAGLAELEKPDGANSDYRISTQLTANLENTVVKKLVVRGSSGFEQIPKERLHDYKMAIIDVVTKANKLAEKKAIVICASRPPLGECGVKLDENLPQYITELYTRGEIKKAGKRTEIILEQKRKEYKTLLYFVFEEQQFKSLAIENYGWMEVVIGDIANPVTEFQWVLQRKELNYLK